ncbi:MAG: hypothetical protein JXB32_20045 [Deltaproteobacteria bacterium]|nr:hypothetical protein [Deltaproteobacteria bacterium]
MTEVRLWVLPVMSLLAASARADELVPSEPTVPPPSTVTMQDLGHGWLVRIDASFLAFKMARDEHGYAGLFGIQTTVPLVGPLRASLRLPFSAGEDIFWDDSEGDHQAPAGAQSGNLSLELQGVHDVDSSWRLGWLVRGYLPTHAGDPRLEYSLADLHAPGPARIGGSRPYGGLEARLAVGYSVPAAFFEAEIYLGSLLHEAMSRWQAGNYLYGGVSLAGGARFAESFAVVLELAHGGWLLLPSRPSLIAGLRYESATWTAGLSLGWEFLFEPDDGPLVLDTFVGLRF